jgi:hypothetical protein
MWHTKEKTYPSVPKDIESALKTMPYMNGTGKMTRRSGAVISQRSGLKQRTLNFQALTSKEKFKSKSTKRHENKRTTTKSRSTSRKDVEKVQNKSSLTYHTSDEDFVDFSFRGRQQRPAGSSKRKRNDKKQQQISAKKKAKTKSVPKQDGTNFKEMTQGRNDSVNQFKEIVAPNVADFTATSGMEIGPQSTKVLEVEQYKDLLLVPGPNEKENTITEMSDGEESSDSSAGDEYVEENSGEVVQSQRGLLRLPYDIVENDCLYCEFVTESKIAPITFVCDKCIEKKGLEKEAMMVIYNEEKMKLNTLKCCASCRKHLGCLLNPPHDLGQFHYCIECIDNGLCKCIVCTSDSLVHMSCKEWKSKYYDKIRSKTEDPYDSLFDTDHLSLREIEMMIHIMTVEKEPQIVLHSGVIWLNMGQISDMFQKPEGNSDLHVASGYSLSLSHVLFYANIMANDCKEFVIIHYDGISENEIKATIQSYMDECFFKYDKKKTIFSKKTIFFLVSLDEKSKHWFVGKFTKEENNSGTLTFLNTNTNNDEVAETIVKALVKEWDTINSVAPQNALQPSLEITLIDVMKTGNRWMWPYTKDNIASYSEKHALYAIFFLRNWMYEKSSDIGESAENKMLTYFALSALHQSPMYYDDGSLDFT